MKHNYSQYIVVFFITLGIFLSVFYFSGFLTGKKLNELQNIQETISLDILSTETQYALLGELKCDDVSPHTVLSDELNELSRKIEYSESNIGESSELTRLKKLYSLLQIKDYLLMKELSDRCDQKSVFILYFYTTREHCTECVRQGYVLTELRKKYPALRVYSFDYRLELGAVDTLESLYDIKDTELPAIVSGGRVYTGFKSVKDIEELIPQLPETLEVEEE